MFPDGSPKSFSGTIQAYYLGISYFECIFSFRIVHTRANFLHISLTGRIDFAPMAAHFTPFANLGITSAQGHQTHFTLFPFAALPTLPTKGILLCRLYVECRHKWGTRRFALPSLYSSITNTCKSFLTLTYLFSVS